MQLIQRYMLKSFNLKWLKSLHETRIKPKGGTRSSTLKHRKPLSDVIEIVVPSTLQRRINFQQYRNHANASSPRAFQRITGMCTGVFWSHRSNGKRATANRTTWSREKDDHDIKIVTYHNHNFYRTGDHWSALCLRCACAVPSLLDTERKAILWESYGLISKQSKKTIQKYLQIT